MKWSDQDIDTLARMRAEGKTFSEIAEVLNRTEQACWAKMYYMRTKARKKRATNKLVFKPLQPVPSTTPPPNDRTLVVGVLSGLSGLLLGAIITILTH